MSGGLTRPASSIYSSAPLRYRSRPFQTSLIDSALEAMGTPLPQVKKILLVAGLWILWRQLQEVSTIERILTRRPVPPPRICKSPPTWIMFMGDSNMRHTYYWWSSRVRGKRNKNGRTTTGSTYGLDRTDLSFGGRWADQECLITDDGATTRFSFRFLHGSIHEFWYDIQNWNVAREASPIIDPSEEDIQNLTASTAATGEKSKDNEAMIWKGKIKPSDYALWATRNQRPIQENSEEFESALRNEWKPKSSPDVVIITQGWAGVPSSDHLDVVQATVDNNPETLFVWAPLYVTDIDESRYKSYVDANVFNWTKTNLRMVDLWDIAQQLPSKLGHQHHIAVGGDYMQKAMERIWNQVEHCMS